MPITVLKTISVSRITAANASPALEDEKQSAFYSLMESFLLLNPTPSDEQVHQLATSVGMDPETFESLIYKFFGDMVKHDEDAHGGDFNADQDLLADFGDEAEDEDTEAEEFLDEGDAQDDDNTVTASNVDDMPMNKQMFDTNDIEPIEAADQDGKAADEDGIPDPELLGGEDPIKEGSESDGAVDEEVLQETYDA